MWYTVEVYLSIFQENEELTIYVLDTNLTEAEDIPCPELELQFGSCPTFFEPVNAEF
jgi:hypothetical protein